MIRTVVALLAGRAARAASRLRGSGTALPGLVTETVDPAVLRHTVGRLPRGVVVVSGTNGKTTTTKMLVAVLAAHGLRVFSNPTGSNFTRGVISALLPRASWRGRLDADIAVLELDEAHSLKFAEQVPPDYVLLLNVARDQLDRFAEIDHTADLLTRLAATATTAVVLNADDPLVAGAAHVLQPGVTQRWFALSPSHHDLLPSLREADTRTATWTTPQLGHDAGVLTRCDEHTLRIDLGDQRVGPLALQQRGLAAMINATAAITMAAAVLGDDLDAATAAAALEDVRPPFGRGEVITVGGAPLELVLVKNPAGFTVALQTYAGEPVPTMVAINDAYADGRDVSWLYDVSFAPLRDAGVSLTSGVRAYDMANRLRYDEVPVGRVEPDLERALASFLEEHAGVPTRVFATYTAMLRLRSLLGRYTQVAEMGEG